MPSPADTQTTRRRLLRAGAGAACALGLAGCVISAEPYTETVDRSFDPGDADDLETVTGALDENPIPVLLPDHRVSGGPYATPGDVRSALRRVEGL